MDADQPKKKSFREAAEAFDRASKLFRQLMPYKDEIASLRQRGASFDTIRELLLIDNVDVSWKTVSRFCRQVVRPGKRRVRQNGATEPVSSAANNGGLAKTLSDRRTESPGPWTPRKRGPRIADSKNL